MVILNLFIKKKKIPLFLPFVVTFPPSPKSTRFFFLLKKSKGKAKEFVGDEDINAVFTIILGEREGELRWWVEPWSFRILPSGRPLRVGSRKGGWMDGMTPGPGRMSG